jgi:putative MFS transporter
MLIAALCLFTSATELSLSFALVAFGVGQALYPAVMTTLGAESFPSTLRATATSAAWALNRVGSFLVPVALLPLLKSSGPLSVGICVTGALLLSAGVTLGFGPVDASVREPQPCS